MANLSQVQYQDTRVRTSQVNTICVLRLCIFLALGGGIDYLADIDSRGVVEVRTKGSLRNKVKQVSGRGNARLVDFNGSKMHTPEQCSILRNTNTVHCALESDKGLIGWLPHESDLLRRAAEVY